MYRRRRTYHEPRIPRNIDFELALRVSIYVVLLRERFDAPGEEVPGVQDDAEEVGGDEAKLSGSETDDAHNGAIDSSDDPALPELFPKKDSGDHSK